MRFTFPHDASATVGAWLATAWRLVKTCTAQTRDKQLKFASTSIVEQDAYVYTHG